MAAQQRAFAGGGRIVMVGRDIGTVILPDADLKVYLTADLEERASRRYQERLERRESPDLDQIRADMKRRDELDSKREHSPLAAARDAIVVDTTGLSLAQVMAQIKQLLRGHAEPIARHLPRPARKG
jgi:cytidylate kinase